MIELLTEFYNFLNAHPWMWAIVALVLSAAVRAMPKPNGSKFYHWLYDFTHILLSNYDKATILKSNKTPVEKPELKTPVEKPELVSK